MRESGCFLHTANRDAVAGRIYACLRGALYPPFIASGFKFFTHSIKGGARMSLKSAPEIAVQKIVAGRHDLVLINSLDTLKKFARWHRLLKTPYQTSKSDKGLGKT